MRFAVHFENKNTKFFFSNENYWQQGVLSLNNKLLKGNELYLELQKSNIDTLLSRVNGFYSFVFIKNEELYAAVDCIRSLPLFYAISNDIFYISDSAIWIANKIESTNTNKLYELEFKCTGYVTGEDTLITEIKQIQAGEYIHIEKNDDGYTLNKKSYFMFTHTEPISPFSKEEYITQLDTVMDSCIEKLIEFANGRQIVIPLSDGRDSRLIAIKLVQKKYNNIICFSYGEQKSQEALISKCVAEKLGLKWFFIPYDSYLPSFLYDSKYGKDYNSFSHNYVSLPHQQDLFAVYKLKEQKLVEKDSVFVPGHAGDFVAGSHIPSMAFMKKLTKQKLIDSIYDRHFCLYCNFPNKYKKQLENRIIKNCKKSFSSVEFADFCELWDWRNRQAKFITNSVRVYEFFEFSWWLPFWDRELLDYWKKIPLQYRYEKNLYNEYVDLLSEKYDMPIERIHNSNFYYFVRKISLLRDLKRLRQNILMYFSCYNKKLLQKRLKNSLIKSFFTSDMIQKFSKHTNNLNGLSIGSFLDWLNI